MLADRDGGVDLGQVPVLSRGARYASVRDVVAALNAPAGRDQQRGEAMQPGLQRGTGGGVYREPSCVPAEDEFGARRPTSGSRSRPAANAKVRTSLSVTTAGRRWGRRSTRVRRSLVVCVASAHCTAVESAAAGARAASGVRLANRIDPRV